MYKSDLYKQSARIYIHHLKKNLYHPLSDPSKNLYHPLGDPSKNISPSQ